LSTAASLIPGLSIVNQRVIAWRSILIVSVIVAAAGAVRLIGARGDLWLDEIWTLLLIAPARSVGEILLDIGHDNNHHLNSIYLYVIGPAASPLAQRGLAVALGTATVVVAGLAAAPRGPARIFAMLLFAFAYPMVHYGSEARGYAGLVLFLLLAAFFLRHALNHSDWRLRHALGAATGLGLLSHLTMVAGAALLGAWATWVLSRRNGSLRQATAATLAIFRPALAWTFAIGGCVAIAGLRHSFSFGGITPFAPADFIDGYGGLIRLLLGVPDSVADAIPTWIWLAAAAVAITVAAHVWRDRDSYISLYFIALIGWPAVMFLAAMPNVQFSRYFLVSGTFFLLFLADALSDAWSRGGLSRMGAAAVLGVMLIGHGVALASFFQTQRGHYDDAITSMAQNGRFSYASDHEFRTRTVVDFFARNRDIAADYVRAEDWCRSPPQFMVVEDAAAARQFAHLDLGTPQCRLSFERDESFASSRLSGRSWTIYRRTP